MATKGSWQFHAVPSQPLLRGTPGWWCDIQHPNGHMGNWFKTVWISSVNVEFAWKLFRIAKKYILTSFGEKNKTTSWILRRIITIYLCMRERERERESPDLAQAGYEVTIILSQPFQLVLWPWDYWEPGSIRTNVCTHPNRWNLGI